MSPIKKSKMKKLVLAYSGGLDTSYCIMKLSQEGYQVHAVSINTGGFTTNDIRKQKNKAIKLGAKYYESINALNSFYEKIIKYLIFGNVLKNNTYPLSVSSERIIQAIEVINYAKSIDAKYVAHGSTGAGNDQVRFDLIFQILAPNIEIITPIRDQRLCRKDEIKYLKLNGINISWKNAQYSINQGLWGTSVGGNETLTSLNGLPEKAYPSQLVETESKKITLEFNNGQVVALNGKEGDSVILINKLQKIAKGFAIGRGIHVGDTIIGIKGRVGFEAAAPLIIINAHHLLEKHTLSKWQQFQKEQLANFYGMLLHEGNYLDPVMRDIEAFLQKSQKTVNGKVFLKLHPYRFELEGIKSKNDLMNTSFGDYGEMNNNWSAIDAKGFIKITSNAHKIHKSINNKE
jgi:argininosuccinate synthase|tara:strand:- start:5142 stop:6350 length:1209 start_codon:yes stop_codon:yes gene_type:complete